MIQIGRAHISLERREVYIDEQALRIGARAFDILEMLIAANGDLVCKEDLLSRVWPHVIVEENNVHVHISVLRKMLGNRNEFIKTIPGRGYRLVTGRDDARAPKGLPDFSQEHADRPISAGLPIFRSPLIGRETAVAAVLDALGTAPLVTLAGPGGIGKTQLAIEVAHLSCEIAPTEACFVALTACVETGCVAAAVIRALQVKFDGARASTDDVVALIANRNILLVLDNCEHVIEQTAALCASLIQACARLHILATSREPLRIPGEQVFRVNALEVPQHDDTVEQILRRDAVCMFIARVNAFGTHFTYDRETIQQIATLCARLDGLPLALELAAARAATLGISELVAELDDRFRVLTNGPRNAPLRQQTLKANLDWSCQFLSVTERTVLRRLCVFHAPFSLEAAWEHIASLDLSQSDITEAIAVLVSKSLLMFNSLGLRRTFHLLESTRAYGTQVLEVSTTQPVQEVSEITSIAAGFS
jgi:predicted ATPase/DNA-binding winged helix-turn-helix (wHTH) protein